MGCGIFMRTACGRCSRATPPFTNYCGRARNMLFVLCLLIMLVAAYVESRQGLLTAATFFVSVILAGVLAYHVWEPLASELDDLFAGDALEGYEDAFALVIPFVIFFCLLLAATKKLAPRPLAVHGYVQQLGGGFFGFLGGYLLAG